MMNYANKFICVSICNNIIMSVSIKNFKSISDSSDTKGLQ